MCHDRIKILQSDGVDVQQRRAGVRPLPREKGEEKEPGSLGSADFARDDTKSVRFNSANLNIIRGIRRGGTMGAFILGLIIGAGGALLLFIYDEGDIFLKLSRQIKQTAERYRQSP